MRHIGPMAQDVDPDGVILAEVKALEGRTARQAALIRQQEVRLAEQAERMRALEAELTEVRALRRELAELRALVQRKAKPVLEGE